jgi:hypothetical protein
MVIQSERGSGAGSGALFRDIPIGPSAAATPPAMPSSRTMTWACRNAAAAPNPPFARAGPMGRGKAIPDHQRPKKTQASPCRRRDVSVAAAEN